jgi:hypothetical protein
MSDRPLSTPGRRPYGDKPGEAPILRRIIRERAKRATWQEIADRLNEAGHLRRNGTPWTATSVAKIHAGAVQRVSDLRAARRVLAKGAKPLDAEDVLRGLGI